VEEQVLQEPLEIMVEMVEMEYKLQLITLQLITLEEEVEELI
jgi:hypothetical protein